MKLFLQMVQGSLRDMAPVVLVILVFHLFVLARPASELFVLVEGAAFVIIGLTFFVYGLELALFPIGDALATALAKRGSVFWLVSFAFLLGVGTTIAEPALIAVADEAATAMAKSGSVEDTVDGRDAYALGLRLTVALSVGVALTLGVVRIVTGWSLTLMIVSGYILVIVITMFAPPETVGIAYDSGGVTTSTITVPLVAALGVGLSSSLSGRNPMIDGFGLIAFASLTPMIFVMTYGMVVAWT
ncbi:MAG: DUF1538 domain-containing protein [Pseudomonadota bacterium]